MSGLIAVVPAELIITDDVLAGGEAGAPGDPARDNLRRRPARAQLRRGGACPAAGADSDPRQDRRAQRASVRALVRAALFANRFPTVTGISNVTVNTDGEGPDGLALESDVRIGIQDAVVFYNQSR
jgi:hypothetical protein